MKRLPSLIFNTVHIYINRVPELICDNYTIGLLEVILNKDAIKALTEKLKTQANLQ